MELTDAYTEFLLAHDYQPATTHSYADRLGAFMQGCAVYPPVTTAAGLSAPLIRR